MIETALAGAWIENLINGIALGLALTIVVAAGIRLCAARLSASERFGAWWATLCLVVVAPLLVAWMPSAAEPMQSIAAAPPEASVDHVWPALANRTDAHGPRLVLPAASAHWLPAGIWIWAATATFLGLRLRQRCVGTLALKRAGRRPSPELANRLRPWGRKLGPGRKGRTLTLPARHNPIAVGWLRPAVLIPATADAELDDGQLGGLWLHEQMHLRRRDDWTLLLVEVLRGALWFHPAVHWIAERLAEERELACDQAVLGCEVPAEDYASLLVTLAERGAPAWVNAPGFIGSKRRLARRVEMLMSSRAVRSRRRSVLVFGVTMLAGLGCLGVLHMAVPRAVMAQTAPPAAPAPAEASPAPAAAPTPTPTPTPAAAPKPAPVPPVPPARPSPPRPPAPAQRPAPPRPPVIDALDVDVDDQVDVDIDHEVEVEIEEAMERVERLHLELEPHIERMHEISVEMENIVVESLQAHQQELERIAEVSLRYQIELRPLHEQMEAHAAELAQNLSNSLGEEKRRAIEQKMRLVEQRMQEKARSLEQVESRIGEVHQRMQPAQDRLSAAQARMHAAQREFEAKQREIERRLAKEQRVRRKAQ